MRPLLFILVLLSLRSIAGTDTKVGGSLIGSQMVANATISGFGGSRFNTSEFTAVSARSYFTESAEGVLRFYTTGTAPLGNFDGGLSVSVKVNYRIEENGAMSPIKSINKILSNKTSVVSVPHAQWMEVVIDGNPIIPVALLPNLVLEASIKTTSYDLNLPSTILTHISALTTDGNLQINWTAVSGAESYELEWTYVSDQSNNPLVRLSPQSVQIDRLLFRNNSSRIETKNTTYQIPMVYEKGLILYRLRTIGKTIVANEIVLNKSEWTSPDGIYGTIGGTDGFPIANVFVHNGFEYNINWQSSLSFAEEGKHKVVMSYHDGTSRNRQAVTRINTDQRAVIGETLYDFNGRPSIQLLPVPVTDNAIYLREHFNVKEGKNRMEKLDYDAATTGIGCAPANPQFSTTTGASRYYSSSNDFVETNGNVGNNMINKNLLPDAKKYPYTQTKYTTDNTGRISAQSGVGETHMLGKGKETRYLYAAPQQEEISSLFGSQVGNAAHFKKNAVIDPNKQVSVSYLNAEGKVVATALAGGNPESLDKLNSTSARTTEASYLNGKNNVGNIISKDYLTKIYNTKFIVTGENIDYKIDYTAKVPTFKIQCSLATSDNPIDIDYKGVVDIELELLNKCGDRIFYKTISSDSGSVEAVSDQTLTLNGVKTDGTLKLSPDEYQLVKTVKIDQNKLDNYIAKYTGRKGTCILTDTKFKDDEIAKIDKANCKIDCKSCRESVAKISANSQYLTTEDIDKLSSACDEICNDQGIACRSSLNAMLGDMSPGGQYGQIRSSPLSTPSAPIASLDKNGNPVMSKLDVNLGSTTSVNSPGIENAGDSNLDPYKFQLSVFNDNNILKKHTKLGYDIAPNWKNPLGIKKNGIESNSNRVIFDESVSLASNVTYFSSEYPDADGTPFYVEVFRIPNDNGIGFYYEPKIDEKFEFQDDAKIAELVSTNTLKVVDKDNGAFLITVKHLLNLKDFIKYFRSSWANYLLPYHPEYPYLVECSRDVQTYTESDKAKQIENIPNAATYMPEKPSKQTFDYHLMDCSFEDAISKYGFMNAAGIQTMFNATSPKDSYDPYFKDASVFDVEYMKQKMANYAKNYSMAKMATIIAGCPSQGKESDLCGDVNCTNGIIDTEEEWSAFRTLYITEKQFLRKRYAQKLAVDEEYYNGCVGHGDEVLSIPSEQYFSRYIPKPVIRQYWDKCYKQWKSCGLGNLDKCGYWEDCLKNEIVFEASYPYTNNVQVCGPSRRKELKSKTPRFFPIEPQSLNPATRIPQKCSTAVNIGTDANQVFEYFPVPCEKDLETHGEQMKTEAEFFKYESCGLCPLASDIESFLRDAASETKLNTGSTSILVSCSRPKNNILAIPQDNDPAIGEVLRRTFGEVIIQEGVYWKSSYTSGATEISLTGSFYRSTNTAVPLATITLRVPVSTATFEKPNIPTSILPTYAANFFRDLKRICCLDVLSETNGSSVFRLKANFIGASKNDEIYIQGEINMDMKNCVIPPRCLLTNDAYRPLLFLNTLCMEKSINDDFLGLELKHSLYTNGSNLNFKSILPATAQNPDPRTSIYNNAIRTLIGKNDNTEPKIYLDDVLGVPLLSATWTSTLLDGVLVGQFSIQNIPNDYLAPNESSILSYNISIASLNGNTPLTAEQLAQFKRFLNVRTEPIDMTSNDNDPCKTGNCIKTSFLADAFIPKNEADSRTKDLYIPVRITIPSFRPVACKFPIPAQPRP